MCTIGIVAEYNPFHNGHKYQIDLIKNMYDNPTIIAVVASSFCERGNLSVLNKWDKTSIALENGVDLVIELPFVFASQSADIFAKGALKILNELKVQKIVFGSESNDLEAIKSIANLQINNKNFDKELKEEIDKGINYPTALSNIIKKYTNKKIDSPNDLLGISYIKEIIKNNYNIEPIAIKRTNKYHEKNAKEKISSATSIRNLIYNNKRINKYVPFNPKKYNIYKPDIFKLLKYKILSEKDLSIYNTVDEGLEKRIIKYINEANNLEELTNLIKTKRYTYNRINRMFIHILTSFTKEEAKDIDINYIRVLGFNNKGKAYLNNINCNIITRYKNNNYKELLIEKRVNEIYSLIVDDKSLIKKEIDKPIIKVC